MRFSDQMWEQIRQLKSADVRWELMPTEVIPKMVMRPWVDYDQVTPSEIIEEKIIKPKKNESPKSRQKRKPKK